MAEQLSKKTFMNYELTKVKLGIFAMLAFTWFFAGNLIFYNNQVHYNTVIGIAESVISLVITGFILTLWVNGDRKK